MATTRVILNVPTVSCDHCKRAIEGAVGALAGVDEVLVDVADKTVTVGYDPASVALDGIEAAIADEGYEVAGRHVFEG
jgi:copper ion binding protein